MPRLYINLLGVLTICSVMVGVTACQKAEAPPAALPIVMVAQPVHATASQTSYAGDVRARQEAALSFRVGGKVTQRLVEVGARVQAGQALAVLDPTDANLQLNAARAQLESSQSALQTAKTEFERYQQLLPANAISRSQFDQIANQYKTARNQLQQAQANYSVVHNQAGYATLRADKTGVIVARNVEAGQVVSAGQPVYTLALDGEREVLIGIPEQAITQFKPGQPVQVSLWSSPDQLLAAYVREVSPAADASRTFAVRVAFGDRRAPVNIGQSARVVVMAQQAIASLAVPLSALTAENQQNFVLVVNTQTGKLEKKPVQTGAYGRDSVPVLSGLNATDWVVIGGVHLLHAGQQVRAIDADNRQVGNTPALGLARTGKV